MPDNGEILLAIGRLQGTMDGVQDHVLAVSRKADGIREQLDLDIKDLHRKVDEHVDSLEAHGAKASWTAMERLGAVAVGSVSIAGTVYALYRAVKP